MWANELICPHFINRILVRLRKLFSRPNGTSQHYTTLPGSTTSYGEHTQTCTFENHANLFAYLANRPLYTRRMAFQVLRIKHQGSPFLGFAQVLSALKNCQNGLLLKHSCVYCRLRNHVRGHIDDLPTLNSVLSTFSLPSMSLM